MIPDLVFIFSISTKPYPHEVGCSPTKFSLVFKLVFCSPSPLFGCSPLKNYSAEAFLAVLVIKSEAKEVFLAVLVFKSEAKEVFLAVLVFKSTHTISGGCFLLLYS